MNDLKIAPKLKLPLDVAGEAIGILAKRGAGKTNTAKVLVEELLDADVQVVVLDPVGVWWGLRSAADGGEGYRVAVLGGGHGDVPLEPSAGALIADVVVESGQPLVLDVSEFSKTEQRRFVADFAQRLYKRKSSQRSLLHLVLEEADEFAPQRVTAGDAPMVGAISLIVKRGRSRGLGLTFVTQRSASLNKDVLDQADVLVVMRTTGPRDRKAIEGWIEHQDADGAEDVLPSLPGLTTGEAWLWNPERGLLTRAQIRKARTFDTSETPKAGGKRAEPRAAAAIDLDALGTRIKETAERAKENDPRALHARIRKLERELAERPTEKATERVEVRVPIEVPVLSDEDIERLEERIAAARETAAEIEGLPSALRNTAEQLAEAILRVRSAPPALEQGEPKRHAPESSRRSRPAAPPARRPAPAPREREEVDGDFRPSNPQQKILDALADLEAIGLADVDKRQAALFARVSPKSSGYTNNLGALRTAGLIHYPTPGRVALTDAGREFTEAHAPPTVDELHDFVFDLVGRPRAAILRVLIDAYPQPVAKEDLAHAAGVSPISSGYTNNLGSLRSLGLIEYPQPGHAAAADLLFLQAIA